MKVTVCFGNVRVVVPCGNGDILVKDLIREATLRYKKATGKGADSWVSVQNLQTQGGGILDPDDHLNDVVDDREQILASFEDGEGAHHHGGGDGASGSSVGTGSPDIFNDGERKYISNYPQDIEVSGKQIANAGSMLQVRRGSDSALNQIPLVNVIQADNTKRWSAAPLIQDPPSLGYVPPWNDNPREDDGNNAFRRRDGSNRLSMQFFEDGAGYRWAEAAEKAKERTHQSTSLPREHKRKEPLGQANSASPPPIYYTDSCAELIIIRNEPGPLGIHVVPDYDMFGKDRGLLVQGIEPGGRIDRDGRLAIYDRIIEINGQNLLNMPFQRVQDMFKLSLTSPELRLRIVKNSNLESLRKHTGSYPKFQDEKEPVSMVECDLKHVPNAKVATVSPTKKIPAVSKNLKALLSANTRKIGRKIEIDLTKGPHGLGFSITTRDNPAGGNCPIYIKNIIPKGAAVEDGRLKIGDRLLEVNGVEMTGKSQSEAVQVLRNAPLGSKVKIVVSRQEEVVDGENELPRLIGNEFQNRQLEAEKTSNTFNEPNQANEVPPTIPPLPHFLQNSRSQVNLPPEKIDDAMIFPWKHKELLTFNIPVHDTEKAGLGISVKGKTSGSQDLGIFIKSVINGGAASRDKRLQNNDQLLNVNGVSLLHQSNSDAMETLRKAMLHTEGPVPGNITLTIARRASTPNGEESFCKKNASDPNLLNSSAGEDNFQQNGINISDGPNTENSGASGSSTNTVIFNPYHQKENSVGQTIKAVRNWNPVIDRLVNKNQQQQLRNESYYKATHDTWTSSMLSNNTLDCINGTSTTVPIENEPILIEDEYGSRVLNRQNSRINIQMTNKPNILNGQVPENRNDHEPDGKPSLLTNNSDSKSTSQTTIPGTDATYASQLSLENPQGFARDAFGRQSMSEKRHAALDAKNTDTYQRTKKLREERQKNKDNSDKLGQLGPSLGMKKSSSLESLQTMVQEIQMQEDGDPAYAYRTTAGGLKVIRGRGCEERIRAAVDSRLIDPNHRSEAGAKKHWLLDPPSEGDRESDAFNVRGAPRQSSLNAALDNKNKPGKKKPSIFKGIGSMFRFGKHRKMDFQSNEQHYHTNSEFDATQQNGELQKENAKNVDLNESLEKVQEQQRKQQQKQLAQQAQQFSQQQQREPLYQRHGYVHRHPEHVQIIPENSVAPAMSYRSSGGDSRRSDRKLQMHRHSYYPQFSEERENIYEHRQQRSEPNTYGDCGKPGSRTGVTESVPYTHYVNYNELQTHLSRKHHQYHSQRQTKLDTQLRPISNFYEYESVQSILNRNVKNSPISPSGKQHFPTNTQNQDINSNARSPQSLSSHSRNHRGPFITQVTIGEKQNGTKV